MPTISSATVTTEESAATSAHLHGLGETMIDGIAGLRLTLPIVITLGAALLIICIGGILLKSAAGTKRADAGIAMLTGAIFLIAAGLTQFTVDSSNFRTSVALESDLTGFDPNGRSLDGFTLAGKKLHAAQFEGADLRDANLSYSDLKEARLRGADARSAELFYAKLHLASLEGADLRDANLVGAEIATPYIDNVQFAGARVHEETCWLLALDVAASPVSPKLTREGDELLKKIVNSGLQSVSRVSKQALGHICTTEEGSKDYPRSLDRIYLCAAEPFLRLGTCDKT